MKATTFIRSITIKIKFASNTQLEIPFRALWPITFLAYTNIGESPTISRQMPSIFKLLWMDLLGVQKDLSLEISISRVSALQSMLYRPYQTQLPQPLSQIALVFRQLRPSA